MARNAPAGNVGTFPPRKTFGTGQKQTNKGGQMGTLSAKLSNPGRGRGIRMGTTSRVKS